MTVRGGVLLATLVLLLGAAFTTALLRLERRSSQMRELVDRDDGRSEAALRADLQALRGELAALRLGTSASAEPRVEDSARDGIETLASSPGEAQNVPNAPEDPAQLFRDEAKDDAWSARAEEQFARVFRAADLRGSHVSTQCRSRTCRVEVVETDPLKPVFDSFNEHVVTDFPSAVVAQQVDPTGRVTSVFYFLRR